MGEPANQVAFEISTPGADAAAAAFGRLAAGLKATNDTFDSTTRSAKNVGVAFTTAKASVKQADDAMRSAADGTRRVASTINVLTGAVQDANPALAGFVNAVGRSGTAISNMSALLGGGLGIVAGGLIAAFGLWTEHMRGAAEASKALADEQKKTNDELQRSLDITHKMALGVLDTRSAATQARDSQIADLQHAIAARTSQRRGAFGSRAVELGRQNQTDRLAIQRLREQGDKEAYDAAVAKRSAAFDSEVDIAEGAGDIHALKAGGNGTTAAGRAELNRSLAAAAGAEAQDKALQQQLATAQNAQKTQQSMLADSIANERSMKKRALDEEFNDSRDAMRREHDLREEYADKQAKLDEKAQERVAMMRSMGVEAYKGVAGAALSSAVAIAAGQKMSTKQVLAGIGDQLIALGIKNELEGSAQLVFGNPGGAVAMGIGALEIGAGLVMGGGKGGAGGAGGAGGGSGASQQRFWNPDASDPTGRNGRWSKGSAISPTASLDRGMGGGGGNTINVYQSSVISPGPQDAINIHRALREGERHGVSA